MAQIEIVFRAGSTRTYTVGNDVVGGVMRIGAIGSGGSGGSGTLFVGGGGKGGSYAERTAQTVSNGDVLTFNIAQGVATGNGAPSTVVRSGVTLVSARGGSAGANAGALNTGAGATAPVGTFTGDIERLGGNGISGSGGGGAGTDQNGGVPPGTGQIGLGGQKYGGNGATNSAAALQGGGAGNGISTINPNNRSSASGLGVITYSTGVGSISHNSFFNRSLDLSRLGLASIVHSPIFDRLLTVRRSFTASTNHVARSLKTIKKFYTKSITHVAQYTRKAVKLRRVAEINHDPFVTKAIVLAVKVATIFHTARFARLVTLRRRFVASIVHRKRQLMKLEGRLIPREGGGGTIIQNFRNLFIFDD